MSQIKKLALEDLPACPVETTLTLIGSKWEVLILRDLLGNGTMRFGELRRSVGGVSQKVLTSQLRQMEAAGLVTREVFAEVPPRVEYSLTSLGRSLEPIINALWDWGTEYKKQLAADGMAEAKGEADAAADGVAGHGEIGADSAAGRDGKAVVGTAAGAGEAAAEAAGTGEAAAV